MSFSELFKWYEIDPQTRGVEKQIDRYIKNTPISKLDSETDYIQLRQAFLACYKIFNAFIIIHQMKKVVKSSGKHLPVLPQVKQAIVYHQISAELFKQFFHGFKHIFRNRTLLQKFSDSDLCELIDIELKPVLFAIKQSYQAIINSGNLEAFFPQMKHEYLSTIEVDIADIMLRSIFKEQKNKRLNPHISEKPDDQVGYNSQPAYMQYFTK